MLISVAGLARTTLLKHVRRRTRARLTTHDPRPTTHYPRPTYPRDLDFLHDCHHARHTTHDARPTTHDIRPTTHYTPTHAK